MSVIDTLPEVFSQFAEQRRQAFLEVKKIKERGIPVVGYYCGYFPQEIAHAAGAATVGLCATSEETIPIAEEDLPKNLCPLIKSSYGFAKADKCPFFYFSDIVVGENTCDGKKKMYEYMSAFKDVFVMDLPNSQSAAGLALWKAEILRLKAYLEKRLGVSITDDKLRDAVRLNNRVRQATKELYEVMQCDPVPILGYDMFKMLYGSTFKFDKEAVVQELRQITARIKDNYTGGQHQPNRPRILITGCPIGGATEKVIKAIENNGGVVAAYENCSGAKSVDQLIDADCPDIYEAIAQRYLNIGCSVMSPNPNRFELLGRLIDQFKIDGVAEMTLTACHTYNVESNAVQRFVTREKHIPYLHVETDYSQQDLGQLDTRMAAFIELLAESQG